jgi:hypothetical protein
MLSPIYMVTHIYITFMLLFIPFFILLLHLWASRLALILLVRNIYTFLKAPISFDQRWHFVHG